MDTFTEWFQSVEKGLEGWPDTALTLALVLLGIVLILVGLFSPSRILKAGVLAWAVLP